MKRCSVCKTEKELNEFSSDKRVPSGKSHRCKSCMNAYAAEYRKKHREKARQYAKKYREENLEKCYAWRAKYKQRKKDVSAYGNKELTEIVAIEAHWVARNRSKATGVQHHVDHIIPLRGNDVSGFHVWNNLRVITWQENIMKSNNLPEDLR